jgi:hypothetical protein
MGYMTDTEEPGLVVSALISLAAVTFFIGVLYVIKILWWL